MGNKIPLFDLLHRRYKARWYMGRRGGVETLHQDLKIRALIQANADKRKWGLSSVQILRAGDALEVNVHALKTGVAMGKGSTNFDHLVARIEGIAGVKPTLTIQPVAKPEIDAPSIAFRIAQDMLQRKPCMLSMKRAVANAMSFGISGIRIECSGRIGGAEIARCLKQEAGSMPRHNIRAGADIQYACETALTPSGCCGIKVWVNTKPDTSVRPAERKPSYAPRKPGFAGFNRPRPNAVAAAGGA